MLAAGTAAGLSLTCSVHAAGNDVIKIGLIGCGGRGSGAAVNALGADPDTRLVAMGDAFADMLESSLKISRPRRWPIVSWSRKTIASSGSTPIRR